MCNLISLWTSCLTLVTNDKVVGNAWQVGVAQICQDNPLVAERFEVYLNALELANGYHELTDSSEQRKRFEKELSGTDRPLDDKLLAALADTAAGLPDCAGVAMGLDRILMLQLGANKISEVISFSAEHC